MRLCVGLEVADGEAPDTVANHGTKGGKNERHNRLALILKARSSAKSEGGQNREGRDDKSEHFKTLCREGSVRHTSPMGENVVLASMSGLGVTSNAGSG